MQVDEGRVTARERQKRQEDIQLEADTLRKGLNMQVRELLKERDYSYFNFFRRVLAQHS